MSEKVEDPDLTDHFDFNEKFNFAGSVETFERPIRSLTLTAQEVTLSGSVYAGEGPFSYRIGKLWGKSPEKTPDVKSTIMLSCRARIPDDDDLQVIGEKRPPVNDVSFDLVLIDCAGDLSNGFVGTLEYFDVNDELGTSGSWGVTLIYPRHLAQELLDAVRRGNLANLLVRLSVRDGFSEGHNEPQYPMTWWFPRRGGKQVWSEVFVKNLHWNATPIALPKR